MPRLATKTVIVERGGFSSALSGPLTRFFAGSNVTQPAAVAANLGGGLFHLEPDDYIGTKLRIRVLSYVNATAPAADFVIGMYPVSAVAGGGGIVSGTVGSVIAITQIALTAPPANSILRNETAEFDWPNNGHYIFGISYSTSMAASSGLQNQVFLVAQ